MAAAQRKADARLLQEGKRTKGREGEGPRVRAKVSMLRRRWAVKEGAVSAYLAAGGGKRDTKVAKRGKLPRVASAKKGFRHSLAGKGEGGSTEGFSWVLRDGGLPVLPKRNSGVERNER